MSLRSVPLGKRLNFTLTRNVVLVGLAISLLVGAMRIHMLLESTVQDINDSTSLLIEAVAEPTGQAAYLLDPVLAERAVAGLTASPYVRSVVVVDDFGTELIAYSHSGEPSEPGFWLNLFSADYRAEYDVPLYAYGRWVGQLKISMNPSRVGQDLQSMVHAEILGYLVLFALMAGALSLVFYIVLTRPLAQLERVLARAAPEGDMEGVEPVPIPRGHEKDEIGSLAASFNSLLTRLGKGVANLRETKAKLEERESHFRGLFENTGAATVVYTPDSVITDCNPTFESLSGYSKEEIVGGMRWLDFVPDAGFGLLNPATRPEPGVTSEAEVTVVTKDGKELTCFVQVAAMPLGGDQVASFVDITERKQTEEALRRALDRISFHVDNSPLAVVEWDRGVQVRIWSSRAEEIFGWTREEAMGKNWQDFAFVHPDDAVAVEEHIKLLQGGATFATCARTAAWSIASGTTPCSGTNRAKWWPSCPRWRT